MAPSLARTRNASSFPRATTDWPAVRTKAYRATRNASPSGDLRRLPSPRADSGAARLPLRRPRSADGAASLGMDSAGLGDAVLWRAGGRGVARIGATQAMRGPSDRPLSSSGVRGAEKIDGV